MKADDRKCWYFAYGSNLDPGRLEGRIGPLEEMMRGRLAGYRFAFNKCGADGSGKANVVADGGSSVWGVVYRCSAEALTTLDGYEVGYERQIVSVVLDSDETVKAMTYASQDDAGGLHPTTTYLGHVIGGARLHDLPGDYVKWMESLA